MTVQQLISRLSLMDPTADVVIGDDEQAFQHGIASTQCVRTMATYLKTSDPEAKEELEQAEKKGFSVPNKVMLVKSSNIKTFNYDDDDDDDSGRLDNISQYVIRKSLDKMKQSTL